MPTWLLLFNGPPPYCICTNFRDAVAPSRMMEFQSPGAGSAVLPFVEGAADRVVVDGREVDGLGQRSGGQEGRARLHVDAGTSPELEDGAGLQLRRDAEGTVTVPFTS